MTAAGVASVGAIALMGLDAQPVRVECAYGGGLPVLTVVGLPDAAIREAAQRVRTAIIRSGFAWIESRVVVSLAPAALRKTGSGFDLAMALGVLGATGQLAVDALAGVWACGELGLDGAVRATPGMLPVATAARDRGARRLVVPESAALEAALVEGIEVVPVIDLAECVAVLTGEQRARPTPDTAVIASPAPGTDPVDDLIDVRGQAVARRALEIAAAGGHHLLMAGPPGCGKSMLARRLPTILPALELPTALEVAAIHSIAGVRKPHEPLSLLPPFRAPHHTTSVAGLIGGGSGVPRPGEISLAHRGVLFLDELLEVPRWILDALREPLESGEVTIVRAAGVVSYPARVLMIAATNPCPCGHLGDPRKACRCRPDRIERYRSRLSGPLLDRIDLQVELTALERGHLTGAPDGEPSDVVAARVAAARARAHERWGGHLLVRDAPIVQVRATCTGAAIRELAQAVDALGLSARAFDRSLRLARTIADVEGDGEVGTAHVEEAIAYRLPVAASVA